MKKNYLGLILPTILTAVCCFNFYYLYKLKRHSATEYQFVVTDDSVTVYDGDRTVGTIKCDGSLDSLITIDNQ